MINGGRFKKDLPVDILVNNTGATCRYLFQMTSTKMLRDVFEVDFFGPYAALFLSSDNSSFITGQIIRVDGFVL